jgi:DNA-binding GntR family transcriptional regulator
MSEPFPSSLPAFKHKRISDELRLLARSLDVGGRLPSERELAVSYGCNFLTIRKAILPLVEDGTVVRITGRGTFVAKQPGNGQEAKRRRIGLLLTPENDTYARRVVQSVAQEAAAQGVELRSI